VRGQIGDGGGTPGQPVQGRGHVAGQSRRLDLELADDAVEVGIRQLQELVEPVHQLDVGIAPQLAEDGGTLDGFVAQAVQLSEQRYA
jgi:hypothetical protein